MTRKELNELGFERAVEQLKEEISTLTDYETLKNFAIEQIQQDNIFVAIHILESIQDGTDGTYYDYDYFMGTMDTPTKIETIDDLEQYTED